MVRLLDPTGQPEELRELGYDSSTWDQPVNLARGQLTTLERMSTAELDRGDGPAVPIPTGAALDLGGLTFRDALTGRQLSGEQFMDRRLYTDALAIVSGGKLIYETYRNGMTEADRHVVHSCSKTLTTMAVHTHQLGRKLAKVLLDRIRERDLPATVSEISADLVLRQTTGPVQPALAAT